MPIGNSTCTHPLFSTKMSTNTGTIHLDLQQLEEIQAQCEAMQDFSALNSLIQAVFTNPDQLSQSFVQVRSGAIS
jgi:hypothetical protein